MHKNIDAGRLSEIWDKARRAFEPVINTENGSIKEPSLDAHSGGASWFTSDRYTERTQFKEGRARPDGVPTLLAKKRRQGWVQLREVCSSECWAAYWEFQYERFVRGNHRAKFPFDLMPEYVTVHKRETHDDMEAEVLKATASGEKIGEAIARIVGQRIAQAEEDRLRERAEKA